MNVTVQAEGITQCVSWWLLKQRLNPGKRIGSIEHYSIWVINLAESLFSQVSKAKSAKRLLPKRKILSDFKMVHFKTNPFRTSKTIRFRRTSFTIFSVYPVTGFPCLSKVCVAQTAGRTLEDIQSKVPRFDCSNFMIYSNQILDAKFRIKGFY